MDNEKGCKDWADRSGGDTPEHEVWNACQQSEGLIKLYFYSFIWLVNKEFLFFLYFDYIGKGLEYSYSVAYFYRKHERTSNTHSNHGSCIWWSQSAENDLCTWVMVHMVQHVRLPLPDWPFSLIYYQFSGLIYITATLNKCAALCKLHHHPLLYQSTAAYDCSV